MNFFFHELLMREKRALAGEILTHAKPPVDDDVVCLHASAEGEADLIVTARITRYSDVALNFDAREGETTQVFQRRITITAEVEIFDTQLEEMYWSSRSVTGVGEYAPESEQEEVGETIALENLTQKIVDGAQSDW